MGIGPVMSTFDLSTPHEAGMLKRKRYRLREREIMEAIAERTPQAGGAHFI